MSDDRRTLDSILAALEQPIICDFGVLPDEIVILAQGLERALRAYVDALPEEVPA